jgi:molybdate transport system ATP-binding protein
MSLRVDIKKSYNGFTLEAAFSSKEGTLALLGASGSGKSMTLKCIAGLISPDEGVIEMDGRILFDSAAGIDLRPQERGVGYLFQNYALFPNMTVRQNIEVAYRSDRNNNRDEEVDALLSGYGLSELAGRYPVQLSGGEQQRAALARIFAYKPQALLLDEPFSALDTHLREKMQADLKRIIRGYEGSVVLVTHSRDEAYKIADDLVILDRGKPVAAGAVREVFRHPGSVRAARITGCKNLSPIEKRGDRKFFAIDWGIELETAEPIGENIKYAGIRAHDFVPAETAEPAETMGTKKSTETTEPAESTGTKESTETAEPAESTESKESTEPVETNIINIEMLDEIDGPFEKDLIVRVDGGTGSLWWITGRDADVSGVSALSIAPEAILLLEA